MSIKLVEPWHPDLLSKEFVKNLFEKNKYEASRFVEINPKDVRGIPVLFKEGDWVYVKGKSQTHGVILETYLVEKWVLRETWESNNYAHVSRAKPSSYELNCLVKWINNNTTIIKTTSLQSLSKQITSLRKKLKKYEENSETLLKYYKEHQTEKSNVSG